MDRKLFYSYVVPSIGSMTVTGLYFVVDGIFVGQGVGANALAAINISVPFISILTSVSMMITMGGATITAISFGKNDPLLANKSFVLSVKMVVLFSLFMSLISILFPVEISKILGAGDILLEDTVTYLRNYVMFGIFFCGSMVLSAFVRNDGNPKLAFWGMIAGACANIFLDWLFIFPFKMGLQGAAIASGLGQIVACFVLMFHFILKKGQLKFKRYSKEKNLFLNILKTGSPEFITQMSQPVVILCYNLIVLEIFGEIGVSAYSVISYIIYVVVLIFIGLAQGIQPLLSRSFGENNKQRERYFFKKGLLSGVVISLFTYVIMFVFGKNIISIFNSDPKLIAIAYDCIIIYGICFLFASVNIVYTIYFQSTNQTKKATVISILRTFVASTIFIFLMPIVFGASAVWTGLIVAEFIVMLIAIILGRKKTTAYS